MKKTSAHLALLYALIFALVTTGQERLQAADGSGSPAETNQVITAEMREALAKISQIHAGMEQREIDDAIEALRREINRFDSALFVQLAVPHLMRLAPKETQTRALLRRALAKGWIEEHLARAYLVQAGDPAGPHIKKLAKALESADPKVRRHAIDALSACGAAASPALPRLREIVTSAMADSNDFRRDFMARDDVPEHVRAQWAIDVISATLPLVKSKEQPNNMSEKLAAGPTPDEGRLDVGATYGQDGGRILSQKDRGDGTKVLHGVQIILGPKNWLKEFSVYNEGALEQRTQFYANGKMFRTQRREHNGDGGEVIYASDATETVAKDVRLPDGTQIGPIKTQEIICQGTIKADKRWNGAFLVREPVPNGFESRLRLHEYRSGALTKNEPFPVEKLGLPEPHANLKHWLWEFPEWPRMP